MEGAAGGVDVVILAAGCGRRMGMGEHKALIPAMAGQGTLERLLGQVLALPVHRVTVVTGHRREDVEAVVRRCLPSARCVHNPRYAESELMQSLACAFAAEGAGTRDCWVLLADTVYADTMLAGLCAGRPGGVAVAVAARGFHDAAEIAVDVQQGSVVAVAGDAPQALWRMAHAVRWPAVLRARVEEAAQAGLRFQWQLIAALLRDASSGNEADIHAILTPADGALDIDTPADLARLARRT